jgi:signal transduction histidine kinase
MTAQTDIPEEVAQVSDADIRAAFGDILYQSLRPIVSGLAWLYAMYAFGHPVFIGGQTGTVLALVAAGTALLLSGLRLGWSYLPSRVPWPHVLGTGITGLVLGNTLLHLYLTSGIIQSTNVILLLLGIGALSLSTPWYAFMASMTLGGWGITVWLTLPHEQLPHYGFAVLSAAVLATIVHVARRRSTTTGERERLRGKQLRSALARSLRAEAATRRDLEESKEALEKAVDEAEQMNRLQAAFLADMSHEIRTPLTSIIGFAEVLDEEATGEAKRFANLILDSSQRLLETVNSVLDLSKLETEEVHLDLEHVDVAEEVSDTVRLFQAQAEEAEVDLAVDAPSELDARLDASALHRCCSNLVSNAIKYTEAGGSVAVQVRSPGEQIVIEVEDTGVGIDPEFQDTLFKPFEQSEEGTLQSEDGTGLGLAITHRLVSLMNGSIDVESTPGEGSVFTVQVPRWLDEDRTES